MGLLLLFFTLPLRRRYWCSLCTPSLPSIYPPIPPSPFFLPPPLPPSLPASLASSCSVKHPAKEEREGANPACSQCPVINQTQITDNLTLLATVIILCSQHYKWLPNRFPLTHLFRIVSVLESRECTCPVVRCSISMSGEPLQIVKTHWGHVPCVHENKSDK